MKAQNASVIPACAIELVFECAIFTTTEPRPAERWR